MENNKSEKNNNVHRSQQNKNGDANFNSLTLSLQGCDLSLKNCQDCVDRGSGDEQGGNQEEETCEICSRHEESEGCFYLYIINILSPLTLSKMRNGLK